MKVSQKLITIKKISILILPLYLISCTNNHNLQHETPVKLAIQPYVGFPENDILFAKSVLDSFFNLDITVLEHKQLDERSFVNLKTPRYRADSIIRFQKETLKNTDYKYILGLTIKDVSTTKKNMVHKDRKYLDWGIMGLAFVNGRSCLISTKRLKKHEKPERFNLRFKKIVLHEFGHNLGASHCQDKLCVMTSAVEKISTIDKTKLDFCLNCRDLLKLRPNF